MNTYRLFFSSLTGVLTGVLLSLAPSSLFAQPKNVLKAGLLGLPSQNYSFGYERVLSKRMSLDLSLAFQAENDLPDRLIDELEDITGGQYSGFAVTPSLRFYGKNKGAPKGFYLGPYARYAAWDLGVDGTYEGVPGQGTGTLNTLGAGLQLGTQWIIAELITIDWYFLGLSVNSYAFDATVRPTTINPNLEEFRDDIQAAITEWPIVGENATVRVEGSVVEVEAPFVFVGLRTGLSVGLAF